ncbi:MAG: endonuclease/exonuclease/phosphatase family protein [Flavobacteriaceae bacterium]
MKQFLKILMAILLFSNFSYAQKQSNKLKVITYNIWNGFDWGKDNVRQEKLISWIKSQQPDVVALQELCGYTEEKLKNHASKWGHEYTVLLKTTGYPVGITSNKPILLKEKIFDGLHHGALHCKTSGIDFMVIHLHPGSYMKRRKEARILIEKLEKVKKENPNYILLGDYNAHSPFDADLYDSNGYFLNRLRKGNIDKPETGNVFNKNLDYAVLNSFLSLPLIDVCQPFTKGIKERGSFPGRVLGPINKETTVQLVSRLERIDYILASPELAKRCINSKVANKKENWFLSDHYPAIAEFDMD